MPGTHFGIKHARRPKLDRWVLRYAFKYSSMISSTILSQTISLVRPSWWHEASLYSCRSGPAVSHTPYRTKYHTRSVWYCRIRTLQGFLYRGEESQLTLSANRKIFTIKLWWKSTAFYSQGADTFPYFGAHSLKISPELRECNGCYWCSLSVTSHISRCYPPRKPLAHPYH